MSKKPCRAFAAVGRQVTSSLLAVTGPLLVAAFGATPSLAATSPQPNKEILSIFRRNDVVAAAELDKLRGGFMMPDGALIRFGYKVQQYVNNTLENTVSLGPVDVAHDGIQNTYTVTQTTPNGTHSVAPAALPPSGFNFSNSANNGQTRLSVNFDNNNLINMVQNTANDQAIRTVTTVNVSTRGFANILHTSMGSLQVLYTIQHNSWLQH